MNDLLSQKLLDATTYGSATIIIVLSLAPLVRRWLGAQAAHALWLIVLVRLLIPWSPTWNIPRIPISSPEWAAPILPLANAQISISVSNASAPSPSPAIPIRPSRPATDWPLTLWAGGTLAMLAFLSLRAARAARLAHRARNITSEPLIQETLTAIGARSRKLTICETSELQSPALCGLFRPTILLPTGWSDQMTATELRLILSHEYGHLWRGDLWWRWAFQIATALHWFNPLVWLAAHIARTDQEMACDEWVLSRGSNTNIAQYGKTLLTTSRRLNRSAITSPVHAGMAETKVGLTRRIRQIARFQAHGWKAMLASAALAASLWLAFGPSQTQAEPAASPSATQFQVAPAPSTTPTASPEPKYTQVQIEAKYLSIPAHLVSEVFGKERKPIINDTELRDILSRLNQKEGCDLASTPRVTTRSGQQAMIQIVREFRYPTEMTMDARDNRIVPTEFETTALGITLEVEPYIDPTSHMIMCSLSPRVADFVGFVNYGSGFPARPEADALSAVLQPGSKSDQVINQPIFETRSTTVSVAIKSGETVVLGDLGANGGSISEMTGKAMERWAKGEAAKQSSGEQNELYAFITARLVDPEETANAARAAAAAPKPQLIVDTKSGLPYGTAVPGKQGYATSPYAPTSGYVDLRGFPSGAEVKCPYTGRLFLVP